MALVRGVYVGGVVAAAVYGRDEFKMGKDVEGDEEGGREGDVLERNKRTFAADALPDNLKLNLGRLGLVHRHLSSRKDMGGGGVVSFFFVVGR